MVQQGVKCTKQKYLNSAVQIQEITKCERNGREVKKMQFQNICSRALVKRTY